MACVPCLAKLGFGFNQIANRIFINRERIRQRARKKGWNTTKQRASRKPQNDCIPCLRKLSYGITRISKLLRINPRSVCLTVKRQNLPCPQRFTGVRLAGLKRPKPTPRVVVPKPRKFRFRTTASTKIKKRLRKCLSAWIKHRKRDALMSFLVGLSRDDFKSHIEAQFKSGMSWENHGISTWHIDHIIPCSAFNLHDEAERQRCFHFSNLRPLSAKKNLLKAGKFSSAQPELLLKSPK